MNYICGSCRQGTQHIEGRCRTCGGPFSPRPAASSNVSWHETTEEARATMEALTSAQNYGGAIAWYTHPCLVIYGVPVWIMPNGQARVGEPNAPMMGVENAIPEILRRRDADR